MAFDPVLGSLGLLVGTLVGLTGVGGGALLTPLLILVAGVRPTIAIGTDLAFAAITKSAGAWYHTRHGTSDTKLVTRLAIGSIPGAVCGSYFVHVLTNTYGDAADAMIAHLLGIALLVAAGASFLRAAGFFVEPANAQQPSAAVTATVGSGVGVIVGATSIGAGSLLMAVFSLFYRLPAASAVGTDVVHGAVLAAVAALAHGVAGRVEVPMLASLLIGSLPGVLVGSWLCRRLPSRPLRVGIATMLAISGVRLL